MARIVLPAVIFILILSTALSAAEKCYIVVENPGSYEQLVVTSITLTMIRQFIDSSVEPAPLGGISSKACMYRVNVVEQESGIKVFIFGNKISDYGKSNLRGEAGLEQGILRAIFKSLANKSKLSEMCQKYGKSLTDSCQKQSTVITSRETGLSAPAEPNFDNGPPLQDRPPGPDNDNMGYRPPPHFKTYRNRTNGFSVSYPGDWRARVKLKHRDLIFSARGNRRFPAMGIFVRRVDSRFKLGNRVDNAIKRYWKKMLKRDIRVKKLDSSFFEIPDQIKVYRSQYKIMVSRRPPLKFIAFTTKKAGHVIVIGLWGPAGMPDRLPNDIFRSFTFDR